jgi:hypothetical protein
MREVRVHRGKRFRESLYSYMQEEMAKTDALFADTAARGVPVWPAIAHRLNLYGEEAAHLSPFCFGMYLYTIHRAAEYLAKNPDDAKQRYLLKNVDATDAAIRGGLKGFASFDSMMTATSEDFRLVGLFYEAEEAHLVSRGLQNLWRFHRDVHMLYGGPRS